MDNARTHARAPARTLTHDRTRAHARVRAFGTSAGQCNSLASYATTVAVAKGAAALAASGKGTAALAVSGKGTAALALSGAALAVTGAG